jgi:hypothetical protein
MCLSTIQKVHKRPLETEGWGWKVFKVSSGNYLYFQYRYNEQTFITNKWLRAKKKAVRCQFPQHKRYLTGFHIFKTKKGALRWMGGEESFIFSKKVCKKVKYKNLRIIGTQDRCKCLVADKLFIPSERQYSDGELALKA